MGLAGILCVIMYLWGPSIFRLGSMNLERVSFSQSPALVVADVNSYIGFLFRNPDESRHRSTIGGTQTVPVAHSDDQPHCWTDHGG